MPTSNRRMAGGQLQYVGGVYVIAQRTPTNCTAIGRSKVRRPIYGSARYVRFTNCRPPRSYVRRWYGDRDPLRLLRAPPRPKLGGAARRGMYRRFQTK